MAALHRAELSVNLCTRCTSYDQIPCFRSHRFTDQGGACCRASRVVHPVMCMQFAIAMQIKWHHCWQGMMAATFVKQRIELDFQLEEFLESAKDAFFMGARPLHSDSISGDSASVRIKACHARDRSSPPDLDPACMPLTEQTRRFGRCPVSRSNGSAFSTCGGL